jgi:hypothetical protein
MGKIVICLMYIVWKKFLRCQGYIKRLDSYITTIILFCIFPIIPMYYPYPYEPPVPR